MARFCPVCNTRYDSETVFCPRDGAELVSAGHDHPGSLIGKTIAERYEVIEQIATGGMGVIYKARQKMLDRYVALKVLPRELSNDPDTERRFFGEARAISQLRHPHIVTLFDFGRTADRRLFIAMEYVQGEPLSVHIEHGPLPLGSAVQIADQVFGALDEAHRAGIVHRDIKPDNVMLEVRGGRLHVRLLDFGIAKSDLDTARLTKTGIVFGTPEYISPEQVEGVQIDARADLYAMGLLLFEMLSGERPYSGSGTAIAYKHAHDPVPSLLEKYPDLHVPPAIDALIYRLMAKAPGDRPSSAEEARRLLLDSTMLPSASSGPMLGVDMFPGDGVDDGLDLEPPGRSAVATVRSGPPPPAPPDPFDPDSMPPLPADLFAPTGPPPPVDPAPPPVAAAPAARSSFDLIGPRPPRPRSAEAPPTIQAPAQLFARPQASRRPLVLGALLGIIGIGSLIASIWVERPIAPEPLATRPAASPLPPRRPAPPPDSFSDAVLAGLTGRLAPQPIPRILKSTEDLAVLPAPDPAHAELDLPSARRQISEARNQLMAMAEGDPERSAVKRQIGHLEWAAANAQYRVEQLRYDQESAAYLNGERDTAPSPPVPAYGDAVLQYQQLVEGREPDEVPELLPYLGHGLLAAGQLDRGRELLSRAVELVPDSPLSPRLRISLADRAFWAGDDSAALGHFEALTAQGDARTQRYARFMLGYVHLSLGEAEAAVESFQALIEAVRDDPVDSETYQHQSFDGLTLAYSRLPGGRGQANSYFRGLGGEALARRQLRLLALAYGARGETAEARKAWKSVIGDLESPIVGPSRRADDLTALAEQDAAGAAPADGLALIEGALARCAPLGDHPSGDRCRVVWGNTLARLERAEEADTVLRPVAEREAAEPAAAPWIAEARFRRAEAHFARFSALSPTGGAAPPTDERAAELSGALEVADAAYRGVEALDVPRWTIAARYRRALLQEQYAAHLRAIDSRPPQSEVAEAAAARGQAHLEEAVTLARRHRVSTRWAQAAIERLGAGEP